LLAACRFEELIMAKHEVWFAIPSASPERCRKTLPEWRKRGYKIAILQNMERGEVPADIVQWSDFYPGWAESINILCRSIVPKSAQIVVSGGCDMLPDPNHTADELAEQFLQRFPDTFGVMQPHGDEFWQAKHYCGSPFLGRKWIDTMYNGTGPMCGEYQHNWADVELYWVANGMGVLWSRPDLTHHHAHFSRDGKQAAPKWWVKNVDHHDRRDCERLLRRAWTRFPGHTPSGGVTRTYDPTLWAADTARIAEKHLAQRYGDTSFDKTVALAIEKLADKGIKRVALWGSGHHTRQLGNVLMDPPVSVECIIDDNAANQGQTLWGFPIVSRAEAMKRRVQAVVISANTIEGKLWDNSLEFWEAGIEVVRLYGSPTDEKNRRVASALRDLQTQGVTRVAIYGAGVHTQELDLAQMPTGVRIECVIDDAPKAASVVGIPVVTPDQALRSNIQAVVLSSDRFEVALWEKSAKFRDAGLPVIRLYDRPRRSAAAATPIATISGRAAVA
jgi:hypothetical protein